MIGLAIELTVSWLLLWIFEKQDLRALGIGLTSSRLRNLLFGLIAAAMCCTVYQLSLAYFAHGTWTRNTAFTAKAFASGTGWTLKSVLFEEFAFRGALLFIAIKKLGANTACCISAIAFGIYHWFSFGVLGNPAAMIFVFLMTGLWGLVFAFAFAKTRSLYLPIGLHLGWDILSIVVFSQGPLGRQLLVASAKFLITGILSLVIFLFQVLAVPAVAYIYLQRQKQPLCPPVTS